MEIKEWRGIIEIRGVILGVRQWKIIEASLEWYLNSRGRENGSGERPAVI